MRSEQVLLALLGGLSSHPHRALLELASPPSIIDCKDGENDGRPSGSTEPVLFERAIRRVGGIVVRVVRGAAHDRIAQSDVASPTMSAEQEVRVDSYTQLNLEKSRLIDQTLSSISFGTPSVGSTSTLLPAREQWTYRYVSIKTVGKTIAGPYSVGYDTTYMVIKTAMGWVVDSIQVKALGTVK
jgi:hypothetical protein